MAKKPTVTIGEFSFDPEAYYKVIFSRPIGISGGEILRAGVEHQVSGERLPPFAEFIVKAEKV